MWRWCWGCAWVEAGASVGSHALSASVSCVRMSAKEVTSCRWENFRFCRFLVGLAKVPAPFMLEGCSYVGQHCAGDVGLVMADAIQQYPINDGPELLHVTGDFLSTVKLEGDGGDD